MTTSKQLDTHPACKSLISKIQILKNSLQQFQSHTLPQSLQQQINQLVDHLGTLPDELVEDHEQERLAALYRVSHSLGSTLNLSEVLNQTIDAVISLFGAERGFLMLSDPDTKELRLQVARNFEHETLQKKDAISRTIIESVLQTGNAVLTTDAKSDPRFSQQVSVVIHSLRAIMCTPMRARGEIIGVIYIDNRLQSGLFTQEDLHLLSAFAAQASIAIDNARLYAQTDQALHERLAELETLTQIDRQLNAHLDLEHIIEITRKSATRGCNAMQAWVSLTNAETNQVIPIENLPEITFSGDEFTPHWFPSEDGSTFTVACPIHRGGKLTGAIVVQKNEPFSSDETRFLERLAVRSANAMENAGLYTIVQQANQAKTRFISVVTHELRIPMTAIKGYTDLLRQQVVGPVNEQQANFLEIIRSNVERMSALVSDLSDISRIESGRLKLEPKKVSLKDAFQDAIASLQPKIDEKQHKISLELSSEMPDVHLDNNRLLQILTNLINNANKYTPEGGEIKLRAQIVNHSLNVDVSDDGIGISEHDQLRLFEQFFRAEDNAVREQQGWGLGLNVTKRLIELMGGEMQVQSKLGVGSVFSFRLPIETNP